MQSGFTRERLGVLTVLGALFVASGQAFVQGYVEHAKLLPVPGETQEAIAAIDRLLVASSACAIVTALLMLGVAREAVGGAARRVLAAASITLCVSAGVLLALATPTEFTMALAAAFALVLLVALVALLGVLVAFVWHARHGTARQLMQFALGRSSPVPPHDLAGGAAPTASAALKITATDLDLLRAMLDFARRLFESEGDRTRTVESKANALIPALGVVAVFTVNAAGLLFLSGTGATSLTGFARTAAVILYILTALALGFALIWALRAGWVVSWQRPHPDTLRDMDQGALREALATEIESLYVAQSANQSRNDQLLDRIRGAQVGLLVGGIGLLALASLLAGVAALR